MYYVNNTLERRTAEAAIRRRKQQQPAVAGGGGASRAYEPRDAGVWPRYGMQPEDAGMLRHAPAYTSLQQHATTCASAQSMRRNAKACDGIPHEAPAMATEACKARKAAAVCSGKCQQAACQGVRQSTQCVIRHAPMRWHATACKACTSMQSH